MLVELPARKSRKKPRTGCWKALTVSSRGPPPVKHVLPRRELTTALGRACPYSRMVGMPTTGHRAHRRRLHQGRRAAYGPAPSRPGSLQWIADATPDSGPSRAGRPGKHRGGPRARLYGRGGCWGSPAVEKITERTFGPLKAWCEKTTEGASCIVNRCRTHQASAGNPCLPRCSGIYVSGVNGN
jgi:hypothetical protein